MLKRYGDLISGASIAIMSVLMLFASMYIKQVGDSAVGADFVPKLVGITLLILSVLLMMRGAKSAKLPAEKAVQTGKECFKPSYGTVALTFLAVLVYVALLEKVGFIIITSIYLFVQILLVSRKEEINLLKFALISVLTSIGIYCLFVYAFGIMIPAGLLG